MLKEHDKLVKQITVAIDGLVVATAFFVAYYLWFHFHTFYKLDLIPSMQVVGSPAEIGLYLTIFFIWLLLWILALSLNGLYKPFRTCYFLEVVWIIIKAAFFSSMAFASLAFIFKIHFVSRLFIFMFIGTSTGLLILEKWIIIAVSHQLRRIGFNYRQLLLVGTGKRAEKFIKIIRKHPEWGFRVIGLIDDEESNAGKEFFNIKVIGVLDDIPRILRENVIDEVVFIVPRRWLERIQKSITACELQGVRASVAIDLFELKIARARQEDLDGFPLMIFESTFGLEWQLFLKRVIDIVVSGLGLIISLQFLWIIALLIKGTSPGPIFFAQRRMGLKGRTFSLYKFRSMYKDASKKLQEVKHLNEMDGPVFKIKNDPRITPLGRILRGTSIDELPQLFNVFMGHMSLVGPRPPIPDEVNEYELWQRRRLSLRPGITCLWQVSGRNKIGFDKWVELDLEYIDNWSLWLDFKILMKTIPVVLFGIGAR